MKMQWEETQKDEKKRQADRKRELVLITETIQTEGWPILVRSIDGAVQYLQNELEKSAAWRVFKGMQLRADIRTLKKLSLAMKKQESVYLAEKLRFKE